ncbi:MAG TPA: sorbosone dehydrogenase family protein [Blastocatellia bacterium]|nr:sorbosone dehydrogenase family protein [Blastocatellia bacterium]
MPGRSLRRIITPVLFALALAGCRDSGAEIKSSSAAGKAFSSERTVITLDSLPKPFHTAAAENPPVVIDPPPGAALQLPPGFAINTFAEGDFSNPRWMIEAANGDLFVADSNGGNIVLLRDANKDNVIDNKTERFTFASGLRRPLGMAIHEGYFYIGNTDSVVRYRYQEGSTKLEGEPQKIIDLNIPGKNSHWARNLLFSPDGKKLYVSIGSGTNVDVEPDPRRAAISEYNPDGSGHRVFASGIRNPTGLAWNPTTKELWTSVNERDGLGDDLVPDYITSVKDGAFYGWPYSYIGKNLDPRHENDQKPDLVAKAVVPDVLLEAHGAALGLVFYTGQMFPKEYQGSAFVALHGSWNRSQRHGYKVIRVPFKDGKPEGGYETFITGWMLDTPKQDVWGRPVGLLQMHDGSLLVVDDGAKKIWRVTWNGKG